MGTKKLPGGGKLSVSTSNKPSGGRKTKTMIVSLKGKKGSGGKRETPHD
jgi:hypothetical protein